MTTWTSLRRPFLKVGRSGRSMRRQVRIASSPGPALAPEERAGDLPGGVHPLLDVDRQGEEVEVVLGLLAGRGGRQQHRLVVEVGGDGAGRLAGQQPGLELDGALAELAVVENSLDGGNGGFHSRRGPFLFAERSAASRRARRLWPPRWPAVRACRDQGPRGGRAGLRSRPAEDAMVVRRSLPRTGPDGGSLLVLWIFSWSPDPRLALGPG